MRPSMPPRNPWPGFRLRILLGLPVVVAIAWLSGYPLLVLVLVLLGLLAWDWYHLFRLETWMRLSRKLDPPQSIGIWGDILDGLYRMRRRSRDRDRQRRKLVRTYRQSIKAMPDGTAVLRGDFRLEWCNQGARDLLGLKWPRDEGQPIHQVFRHPEFVELLEKNTDQARVLSIPSPIDSRLWLEIRLIPFEKKRHLLLARDTTAMRRLETMRRDFVANVSHELRTPLTVIYGAVENIEDAVRDDPQLTRSVHMLQEQAERMKNLVDDLLLLSRLEMGAKASDREWVDVPALLEYLAEEAQLLSGARGHQIEVHIQGGLGLFGEETELRSAFANILFNAVNYTPDGGLIRLRWFQDGKRAVYSVSDSGIGIEPQHIPRLTERFYRVDKGRSKSQGGTGLGLAIVKHVILRHGSELHINSELGKGSEFQCRFPAERVGHAITVQAHAGVGV